MNKTNKYRMIFYGVPVLLFVVYWINLILAGFGSDLWTVRCVLYEYIQLNSGIFPAKEDDLISQKLLRKIEDDGKVRYELFIFSEAENPTKFSQSEQDRRWVHCRIFDEVKILYGISDKKIERVNNKIYDKNTNEQILLIDGSYRLFFKSKYESLSLDLYEAMLKYPETTTSLE